MKRDPLVYLSALQSMALMLVDVDFRDHPASWNEQLYDIRLEQLIGIMETAVKSGDLPHRSHNMFGYIMPPSDALDEHGNVRTDTVLALSDVWQWRKNQGLEDTESPEELDALFRSIYPDAQEEVTTNDRASKQKVVTVKPRGPVPDAKKNAAYLEGNESLISVAQEMKDSGRKVTKATLSAELKSRYRGTSAAVWGKDYISPRTMAEIKREINHD